MIKSLEDLGEVNVKLSTHVLDKQDDGSFVIRCDKKVCFALDAPKETKRKKAGKK